MKNLSIEQSSFKRLVATLLSLAVFTAGSYTQALNKAKLDQLFNRLNEKNKAMGSLVLLKGGNAIYNRSIGYSYINGKEKKPSTAATKYRVGSVTKVFTAAMIFQLVEEGKIRLTDNLDKFFPQVPNANKITIVHLLGHRSGIRDVTGDQDFRRTWRLKSITKDEMVTAIVKTKPDFEPDAKFSYSSAGYFLLGMIIENLTGKNYQEALKERITSKIGLSDTYLGTENIDVNKNESFSYRYQRNWEQQPEVHPSIVFGSGGLISTPADMATFIHALFEGKIVSKKSLEQMTTIKEGYGLGMEAFTYNGKTFYGHTGGIDNFGSWLAYLPEEKLALAYSSNAKVYEVSKIIDGVFSIYYNMPFTIPTFEQAVLSAETLDKYVGVYSTPDLPFKLIISRDGMTLLAQPSTAQNAFTLEAIAEDKFKIESAGIEMEFNITKRQMTFKQRGKERLLTKEN